jgi:hypothetical protein
VLETVTSLSEGIKQLFQNVTLFLKLPKNLPLLMICASLETWFNLASIFRAKHCDMQKRVAPIPTRKHHYLRYLTPHISFSVYVNGLWYCDH